MNPGFPPISDPHSSQSLPAKSPGGFLTNVVWWILAIEVWLLFSFSPLLKASACFPFTVRFGPFRGWLYPDVCKVSAVGMIPLPLCFMPVVLLRYWLLTRKTGKSTHTP